MPVDVIDVLTEAEWWMKWCGQQGTYFSGRDARTNEEIGWRPFLERDNKALAGTIDLWSSTEVTGVCLVGAVALGRRLCNGGFAPESPQYAYETNDPIYIQALEYIARGAFTPAEYSDMLVGVDDDEHAETIQYALDTKFESYENNAAARRAATRWIDKAIRFAIADEKKEKAGKKALTRSRR